MITFAITVCNELTEFCRLVDMLCDYPDSQIIVQSDSVNVTPSVLESITEYQRKIKNIIHYSVPLENEDFAAFKNRIFDYADGDWIFQIDADEYPTKFLLESLSDIIESNGGVDVFLVPRLNYVRGLTGDHVDRWGWKLSMFEDDNMLTVLPDTIAPEYLSLVKKYGRVIPGITGEIICEEPVINFPDYQWRLYRNIPSIRWVNKVHERLYGFKSFVALPSDPDYCLVHIKEIDRQVKQNDRYSKIT